MSAKVTLQQLSEVFAKSNGLAKKTSEIFVKHLFDTVTEGLLTSGVVKVKGWGTFKLVDIGARESVSVSTGERVLIPGYKKVTFIPEDILLETEDEQDAMISEETKGETKDADVEDVNSEAEQNSESVDCSDLDEKLNGDVVFTDTVEQKNDDFSGIDLLISTPECIEGAKEDLWKARNVAATMRAKAEQAISLAKNAEREVLRLETLIENLEKNKSVEVNIPTSNSQNQENDTIGREDCCNVGAVSCKVVSGSDSTSVVSEPVSEEEKVFCGEMSCGDGEEGNKKKWFWVLLLVFFLLIFAGGYYWFFVHDNNVKSSSDVIVDVEETTAEEQIVKVVADTILFDSLSVSEKADTTAIDGTVSVGITGNVEGKSETDKEDSLGVETVQQVTSQSSVKQETPVIKPDKYVLKEGETLTMLARRFYGSPDYVVDIINANNFSDPNNVHVGAIVVLP